MSEYFKNLDETFFSFFDDEYYWHIDLSSPDKPVWFSKSVGNVTGYKPEELQMMRGKGKEIIFEDDIKRIRKLVDEFKNDPTQNKLQIEFRIRRKDDKLIWVKEEMFTERNSGGELVKFFGKVTEISKYKAKEEALIKKIDEIKQVNSAKDQFISILSHDLRAPFTSILGFSEILLNEPNIPDKEKAEYLSYINDSSQNQLQLINYLLDYSRLQTGRLKIEPQRVQAQNVVFNCVSSLTGNAIRKNIDIKVEIPESIYIEADERLFNQVIINLLSNAIKFSYEETTIEIYANVFNDKFIEFVVKDQGIGISEENKDKLFQIGKMFSTEGTKGEKGTGLGLALVKQIVEKHGGELWFYSSPDEGSEFHFTIPSSTNSIIVVKRNAKERKELVNLLKSLYSSYRIISAENGYDAMRIILKQIPSLIIMDHEMPLMTGRQLVQTLKRENNNLNIPVIVLLKEDSDEIKKAYQEYGIKTVCANPLDTHQLQEKLNESLVY